jgi:hypothetical protein
MHRDEIASCSEAAYASLKVSDAQKLMMFKSTKEAEGYAKQVGGCGQRGWWLTCPAQSSRLCEGCGCVSAARDHATLKLLALRAHTRHQQHQQRGWTVEGGLITFPKHGSSGAAGGDGAGGQHLELINHALVYAKELERIV